jgi:hypothetical protein
MARNSPVFEKESLIAICNVPILPHAKHSTPRMHLLANFESMMKIS